MIDLDKSTPAIKWLCYLEGPCAKERPLASDVGVVWNQEAQHATPKTLSTHKPQLPSPSDHQVSALLIKCKALFLIYIK